MPLHGFFPSFAGGLLGPALHGRLDIGKYDVGLRVASNVFILTSGGFSNRMGTEFVAEVIDSTKTSVLVPFQPTVDQTYVIELGDLVGRIVQAGGVVVEAADTITGITQANPGVVTCGTHGIVNDRRVFISGITTGPTELNGRTFVAKNVTATTLELEDMWGTAVDTSALTAWSAGGTVEELFQFVSPYTEIEAEAMKHAQSADTLYMAHRSHPSKKLQRTASTTWPITDLVFDPQNAAPTGVAVVSKNAGTITYTYVVSSVDVNGIESFQSTSGSDTTSEDLDNAGAENVVTWVAAAGAVEYRVYRELNGIFGFVGFTDALTFTDDNIAPDTTDTPVQSFTDLQATDEYPGAVGIYQQRLALGSTNNLPEDIWESRIGDYENFTKSRITKATDRLHFSINGNFLQHIHHIMPIREMLVLTNAGEWSVAGVDGVLTPGKEVITQHGYAGASVVSPLVVNDSVLYVERFGNVIRDLRYAFETDGYQGNELSIFVPDLFRGRTVRDWTYAKSPFSIIWLVMSDGDLLSLTYHREHQVWAWAEHDVGGVVETITSVEESGVSAVYMTVKRTINSQTKRYIERMGGREFTAVEDGYFVDAGITYSGASTTSITGLEHLLGETVVALADGEVVGALTVAANGVVTLANAAVKAHVGKSYISDAETLPPNFDIKGKGKSRGLPQKVNKVQVQVERTRGISTGPNVAKLQAWRQPRDPLGLHIVPPIVDELINVHVDPLWTRDGTVYIRQSDPLPMTVLAVAPDMTVGT